jgi:hypothetical protein
MLKCDNCSDGLVKYLNKCQEKCPTGYIANDNNYCICSAAGTLTINDKCLILPACPLLMGWDPLSSSCLSCSFGCTTCYNLACTSCNPGYFLYISCPAQPKNEWSAPTLCLQHCLCTSAHVCWKFMSSRSHTSHSIHDKQACNRLTPVQLTW